MFGAPTESDLTERDRRHGTSRATADHRGDTARHVMLMLNPNAQPRDFVVPELVRAIKWRRFINTAAASPEDIFTDFDGPPPPVRGPILLAERSLVCFLAEA